MNRLRTVRAIAVDCDGVLINDTYLAVIEQFINRRGGSYDEQAEKDIIGLQDVVVAERIALVCGLKQPTADTLAAIWAEREQFLQEQPIKVNPEAAEFLTSLRELGVRVLCYGGRTREHTFEKYLGNLVELFDPEHPYVSVNEHRPGVDLIVRDVLGCDADEVIFIDDVSRVAQAARNLGSGFIGFPSSSAHRRQRRFMEQIGVRHIVGSLGEITPSLIAHIDEELARSRHWITAN